MVANYLFINARTFSKIKNLQLYYCIGVPYLERNSVQKRHITVLEYSIKQIQCVTKVFLEIQIVIMCWVLLNKSGFTPNFMLDLDQNYSNILCLVAS